MLSYLKRFRRAPVKIIVGKAYTLPPLPKVGRDQALAQYTDEMMCRIAALLPEEYRGVYGDHPMVRELLTAVNP
jgi:1-acyl-sn-glycerol-3-phosphate acyltransferase